MGEGLDVAGADRFVGVLGEDGAQEFEEEPEQPPVRNPAEAEFHKKLTDNTSDFAEIVLRETDNHGVDVVFDNVGEAVMEKSLQCTKYNGRYLMMGFASNKLVADEPWIVPRRIALVAHQTANLTAKLYGVACRETVKRD